MNERVIWFYCFTLSRKTSSRGTNIIEIIRNSYYKYHFGNYILNSPVDTIVRYKTTW